MPFPEQPEALRRALDNRGYVDPTPVQAATFAPEAAGRDLLVSARTGSGKTVAFGLALAPRILDWRPPLPEGANPALPYQPGPNDPTVRALVIAPTRELAQQVASELTWLYAGTNLRILSCVGGMDPVREARALRAGAHIVVGTPGRLCDHLNRRSLDLRGVSAVVLDEADEMLDMGFRDELETLLDATPKERQTLLFSATVPPDIERLAGRYQRNALRVATADTTVPHADIQYQLVPVAEREREHAIVNLLRFVEPTGALIFCSTREGVGHLHSALAERGFAAVALSGELTQAERGRALTALRDGRARVLVATDVAARGLDLPALDLVIHADLPTDPAVLLHRSGRTGRAGRKGVAILLVTPMKRRLADRLVHSAKIAPMWVPVPSAEAIDKQDQTRLSKEILEMPEGEESDKALAAVLLETRSAEELAAVLVRLCRAQRPAAESLPETEVILARARASERRPPPPTPRFDPRARPAERPPERSGERPPERSFPDRPPERPRAEPPTDLRPARPERRPPSPPEARPAGQPEARPPGSPEARTPGSRRASERGNPAAVWFRVNLGRQANADPKWLIPLICRRGRVEKRDIGEIKIQQRETWFEIAPDALDRFMDAASRPDPSKPNVVITRLA